MNAMSAFEFDRFLRSHDFVYSKEGGRHRLYSYQGHHIAVPRGKGVKAGTVQALKKQIKDIKAVVLAKLPSEFTTIEIPESGCEVMRASGENNTALSDEKFLLYAGIIAFCQDHAGGFNAYTLRELLLFIDHQIADFNNLVSEAIQKNDLAVLFDLREGLELVGIHSHQVNDAIAEFEDMTDPKVEEPAPAPQPEPGKFVTARRTPPTPVAPVTRIAAKPEGDIRVEGVVVSISAGPPSTETEVPNAVPEVRSAPAGLSPRKAAVSKIMAIFDALSPDDANAVLRQVTSFVEMG